MFAWVAAAIILTAIVAVYISRRLNPPQPRDIVQLEHILPDGQHFNVPVNTMIKMGHTLTVSPDGRKVVYSTEQGLFLRTVDRMDAVLIPGTR